MTDRCISGVVGPSADPSPEPAVSLCEVDRSAPEEVSAELSAELPAESLDVSLDASPEAASPLLSSEEQAASRAVMVRAVTSPVRSPAVRERVAVKVMAVRRGCVGGRFRS
jgi:hypothetical protein